MPTFVHPGLLWGLGLLALPLLIHLINTLRHRRVEWAAMEFLLASQRRSRRWILLRQWLLLAARLAAVAAIVLMVAQPAVSDRLGSWLGGSKTHHVVLLDDSFSMADRWSGTSAFDEAKGVIARLGQFAASQRTPQVFSLVRFSRSGRITRGVQPDLNQVPVDAEFAARLDELVPRLSVSQLDTTPAEALAALTDMLGEASGETRLVYLVSDFRRPQWDEPRDALASLQKLREAGARLHLVDCAGQSRPNLTLARLAPLGGMQVAGVPLFMEVSVRNHSAQPARNVNVSLTEDGRARPSVAFNLIPPGKTETRRFQVHFAVPGEHVVAAQLEGDALAIDNDRYCVLSLPASLRALIIDGSPEEPDASYLAQALAPGGTARTGIDVTIQPPSFLHSQPLDTFRTIYLINVPRLDEAALEALDHFVAGGGGLTWFGGELCDAEFVNAALYRGGEGWFPLPLVAPAPLPADSLEPTPDLEVEDHPVFKILAGQRNSFIGSVAVGRYWATESDWAPPVGSTVRVLARLRNGAPLAVEQSYGQGRVVAVLTTAGPGWNNWARNPSYVVTMLELQSYLTAPSAPLESALVGTPLALVLDPTRYQPQVRLARPNHGAGEGLVIDAVPTADGLALGIVDTTDRGIYELVLSTLAQEPEVRRFAYNVAPEEGNLERLDSSQLAARLGSVPYTYLEARGLSFSGTQLAGSNLARGILYLLVGLLVCEQLLAYAASYHPSTKAAPR